MNRFSSLSQPRREASAGGSVFHWIWATIAGLIVPVVIVVFGLVAELIDTGGLPGPAVRLGTNLDIPLPAGFEQQDGFAQLTELVVLGLMLAALFSLSVWLNRRSSDKRARRAIKSLHKQVLAQSLRRAEVEGAAAQRARASQLIGKDLPQLGLGLSLWYRVNPRSILMLVGCVALALLVNVWLAILAVISGAALWRLYNRLRNPDWLELSRFEIPEIRKRLVSLIGDAPMMARLQAGGLADETFGAELESLDRRIVGDDARKGRLWPLLMIAGSLAIAVLIMGLGVNILSTDGSEGLNGQGLSLPASLVLGLSLTGAAFSAARLSELARQLRRSSRACEAIYLYLDASSDVAPSEQRVGLAGLRESVELQDVSLNDSSGKPILNSLSLSLKPKSLVGLMGTDEVSTRSLVELLMGFGRPSRGVVQIDGISLRDVHPVALAKQVMWLAPDGPIWEGTVTDNLMAGLDKSVDKRDMVNVLEELGMYEGITRLSDGLDTIIGPLSETQGAQASLMGDASGSGSTDSLSLNSRYMLGVARALLHRPAILLAKEPPAPTEHLSEDPCLKAMLRLAELGTLVVVLPHRLQTLRSCNRVVLLNGANLVGEGRHTDLLNTSDLYRHLNYLLFNPYRHRSGK